MLPCLTARKNRKPGTSTKPEHLEQVPGSPAGDQQILELLAVNEHQHLQEEVDEHRPGADPRQADQDAVVTWRAARGSTRCAKTLWLIDPSKITMDRPAKILETKKSTGMNSEYQRGWILLSAIRNRAPRPDWCSVESVMPKITAAMVNPPAILRSACHAQPLGHRRRELDELGGHVEHEVPGHEEQHRTHAELVADDRVDDVPGPAQVQHQGAGVEHVGQEAVQHHRPDDGVVFLARPGCRP